jgi:hypothetical protein
VEAGVIRTVVLAIVAGLTALGCDADPARSVQIVDRPRPSVPPVVSTRNDAPPQTASGPEAKPPAAATVSKRALPPRPVKTSARPAAPADPTVVAPWSLQACPPPPEDSPGPSSLAVSGPCAFSHVGAVSCASTGDDFIVAASRKAAGGATLVLYINVEKYRGPGTYVGTQMFVAVQDGKSIYRWSNDNGRVTVGADEKFVAMPTIRLAGEPLHIDCSRQIEPATNYQFQCEGTADAAAMEQSVEEVSGVLRCAESGSEP